MLLFYRKNCSELQIQTLIYIMTFFTEGFMIYKLFMTSEVTYSS